MLFLLKLKENIEDDRNSDSLYVIDKSNSSSWKRPKFSIETNETFDFSNSKSYMLFRMMNKNLENVNIFSIFFFKASNLDIYNESLIVQIKPILKHTKPYNCDEVTLNSTDNKYSTSSENYHGDIELEINYNR